MNITGINLQSFKSSATYTPIQNNPRKRQSSMPSLLRSDNDIYLRMNQIARDKARIYSDIKETKRMPENVDRLRKTVENTDNLEQLRKDCAQTNILFNISPGLVYSDKQKALAQYLDKLCKLNKHKGLNGVFGYDEIKENLQRNFIINVMARDKMNNTTSVPNAILFYGPTGCGKTFFAQSLAQHTLSRVETIENTWDAKETMEQIKQIAKDSLENYENSKEEKQRTIIIINEAESFAHADSEVIDEFRDFALTCASKYKCILFLTTNWPLDIDKAILSSKITPYKVGINYPNKENAKRIIQGKIDLYSKSPIEGSRLIEELFKNEGKFYSAAQISDLVEKTIKNCKDPKEQDYIDTLNKNYPYPSISQDDVDLFEKEERLFNLTK